MAKRINRAYEIVLSYCENYEYPFGEELLKREAADGSYERWWQERFGDDPSGAGRRRKVRAEISSLSSNPISRSC